MAQNYGVRNQVKPKLEPLSKRRRYQDKSGGYDLEKVVTDLRHYLQLRRGISYLPTPTELIRADYWNLGWALRKLGYFSVATSMELPTQPDYYERTENIIEEIAREFTDAQWKGRENDPDFEPIFPSFAQLRTSAQIFAGIAHFGGLTGLYQEGRYGSYPPDYFTDIENLRTETEILMRRSRSKALPTYAQLLDQRKVLAYAYLFHGGYPATADKLGVPALASYLKDPINLKWELQTLEIRDALKSGERILPNGLPDCWMSYIPTEDDLRRAGRSDLHRAILEHHGGYFYATPKLEFWFPSRFWEDNPSLKREMKLLAKRLKHPKLMPTKDELNELDRPDLAKAIDQNGGYRKTAAICGLAVQKPTRSKERPLKSGAKLFVPYPFRRFDPKLSATIDGLQLSFEVPTETKAGAPAEYGVWITTATATLGRVGWIRGKKNGDGTWLYRQEGESTWRGTFSELDWTSALSELLSMRASQS